MKEFLNQYMASNRQFNRQGRDLLVETFKKTINALYKGLGKEAFKPFGALNAAAFDSIMVGMTKRLEKGDVTDFGPMKDKYYKLLKDGGFVAAIERATADPESVKRRISMATAAFADLK